MLQTETERGSTYAHFKTKQNKTKQNQGTDLGFGK